MNSVLTSIVTKMASARELRLAQWKPTKVNGKRLMHGDVRTLRIKWKGVDDSNQVNITGVLLWCCGTYLRHFNLQPLRKKYNSYRK